MNGLFIKRRSFQYKKTIKVKKSLFGVGRAHSRQVKIEKGCI
jgi:hypothetical protein